MRKDIVELSFAGERGSVRLGYLLGVPGRLMLFVGSVPEIYPVLDIPPKKGSVTSRSYMKKAALAGQKIVNRIYVLPKEDRPKTYVGFADLLAELLANELLLDSLGYDN